MRDVDERAAYHVPSHAYDLTERGRKQAEITGAWLREKYPKVHVRYVSYYKRAKDTMAIMFPGEEVYEDPRLAEAQRGIYNTMTRKQVEARFPEELERKEKEGLYHYRPLGGESSPDIELRIESFLSTLTRDCRGKTVVIVVHGHWLILFQRVIHHFSIEEAMARYHGGVVPNASVTEYRGTYDDDGEPYLKLTTPQPIVPWEGKL